MNLKIFYLVSKQLIKLLTDYDPQSHYQNLISHFTSMRSGPTADLETSIQQERQTIAEINENIESELDKVPHAFFVINSLNIADLIGQPATNRLDEIMRNDTFNAPDKIQALIQEIANCKSQLQTIITEFEKFGLEYLPDETPLLGIEFNGDYEIKNTEDLKARLDDVESIVRAYARLSDKPDAFKKPVITSISKSSPVVIDIGDGAMISSGLLLVAHGIKWSMDRVEQVNRIKIQREQVKQNKMLTKKMEAEFKTLEQEQVSEKNIKLFVEELIKKSKVKLTGKTGANEEIKKDLLQATKLLIKLISGGTKISIFPPPSSEPPKEGTAEAELGEFSLTMTGKYKEIDSQANKLKLIEAESKKAKKEDKPKPESDKADGTS